MLNIKKQKSQNHFHQTGAESTSESLNNKYSNAEAIFMQQPYDCFLSFRTRRMYCANVPIIMISVFDSSNLPTVPATATSPPLESISCLIMFAVSGSTASNFTIRKTAFNAIIWTPIGWTPILISSALARFKLSIFSSLGLGSWFPIYFLVI